MLCRSLLLFFKSHFLSASSVCTLVSILFVLLIVICFFLHSTPLIQSMVSIRMECIQISDRPFKFYWGGGIFSKEFTIRQHFILDTNENGRFPKVLVEKLQGLTIRTFHVVNLLFFV